MPDSPEDRTIYAVRLRQIAGALGTSVEGLLDEGTSSPRGELSALLEAFVAITDARARHRALAFVRAEGARSSGDGDPDAPRS